LLCGLTLPMTGTAPPPPASVVTGRAAGRGDATALRAGLAAAYRSRNSEERAGVASSGAAGPRRACSGVGVGPSRRGIRFAMGMLRAAVSGVAGSKIRMGGRGSCGGLESRRMVATACTATGLGGDLGAGAGRSGPGLMGGAAVGCRVFVWCCRVDGEARAGRRDDGNGVSGGVSYAEEPVVVSVRRHRCRDEGRSKGSVLTTEREREDHGLAEDPWVLCAVAGNRDSLSG